MNDSLGREAGTEVKSNSTHYFFAGSVRSKPVIYSSETVTQFIGSSMFDNKTIGEGSIGMKKQLTEDWRTVRSTVAGYLNQD